MEGSYVEDALDAAEAAFRDPRGQTPETGLDTDDGALTQLRKACRLLEAARTLRAGNGYYTVVIEASFVAVERSIQAYLLHRRATEAESIRHSHIEVYDVAVDAGLFGREFADRVIGLWEQNRAAVYYQETAGSDEQATAMLDLAEDVHRFVREYASIDHECICSG